MGMRKQARQRRREKIEELLGKPPYEDRNERMESAAPRSERDAWEADPEDAAADGQPDSLAGMNSLWDEAGERPTSPAKPSSRSSGPASPPPVRPPFKEPEPDPEKWWKERQRTQFAAPKGKVDPNRRRQPEGTRYAQDASSPESSGYRGTSGTPGSRTGPIGSLADLSAYRGLSGTSGWEDEPPVRPPFLGRLVRGLVARCFLSLVVFAAIWGWMRSDLPGSGEVQALAIHSVTQDMDFDAVEAWYEKTFGGSPAFLPIFRHQQPSQAAIAEWSRDQTVPPLDGRVVQTFDQDGSGIRMAAPSGSPVKAVHSGRVTKVATDNQGVATVWVQHPNQIVTEYSGVENPEVKPSDWVESGQTLGGLASPNREDGGEGTLFFAVVRSGKTIDPADVVPFA